MTSDNDKFLISRTEESKRFPLPQPKKAGDCGYDLYTARDTIIPAHNLSAVDVPTGVRVKLPLGTWGLIVGRSGALRKSGLEIVAGVIDNGYTGELFACCYNRTEEDILIKSGTRLVQIILLPMVVPELYEVKNLPETQRGETGFGSSGQ